MVASPTYSAGQQEYELDMVELRQWPVPARYSVVLLNDTQAFLIADGRWQRWNPVTGLRVPVPNQLTMYAASQGPGGTAAMIYPRHEAAMLPEERLDLFDPIHAAPHATLYLRPVPILELVASLDAGEQGTGFRRRLARMLALGASQPSGSSEPRGPAASSASR